MTHIIRRLTDLVLKIAAFTWAVIFIGLKDPQNWSDVEALWNEHHLEITERKAQELLVARGLTMCRQEADNYITQLLQICRQNGFQANPRKIFNMD
jgi:hypothetical protein